MNTKRWQKEAFARRYRHNNFAPVVLTKPQINNRFISWYMLEKMLGSQWREIVKKEKTYKQEILRLHAFALRSDLTSET